MKNKNNGKPKQFLHVVTIQSHFKYFFQTLLNVQIVKYCHFYTNWPKHIPIVAVTFIPLLNGKLDIKS